MTSGRTRGGTDPERVRSGRRMAVDIEAPRDRTVCFTVSDDERDAIDQVAAMLRRTRSSVLTRIVIGFVEDALEGGEPERLLELHREVSQTIQSTRRS